MDAESSYANDEDEQLHHVLLPRVLPQEKCKIYQTEIDLLNRMAVTVDGLAAYLPPKTVQFFQNIRKVHTVRSPTVISNVIRSLQPGDTFAMFVRFQHRAIMIHVPESETSDNIQNAIVATIPGSLHPSEVYKHDGDMEFNYPEQAKTVTFSAMLQSEAFANQLCVVFAALPIERQNRDCVSKWLVALLMNYNSKDSKSVDFPVIKKKIRDEMLGHSNTNYFRRSSFYMSLKVLLQHNLEIHCRDGHGKLIYKIVVLKFFTEVTAPYMKYDSFDIDLLSQMIAKLARRIEKLPENVPDKIAKLHETVIAETKETIKMIRCKIDEQIRTIHQTDEESAQLPPLTGLNFEADICHEMKKLDEYLQERINSQIIPTSNKQKPISSYKRYFKDGFPQVKAIKGTGSRLSCRIFWLEFEKMVLYEMKMGGDNRWSTDELHEWSLEYAKYAEKQYMNNPLFNSRMLLVRLKLVAVLDQIATENHHLLKEYHSGVNPKMIESLLIPQREDLSAICSEQFGNEECS